MLDVHFSASDSWFLRRLNMNIVTFSLIRCCLESCVIVMMMVSQAPSPGLARLIIINNTGNTPLVNACNCSVLHTQPSD